MAFAKGFFDRQAGAADVVFTPTTSIPVSTVQDAIQYVWDNVNGGVAGTYAPPDAEYLTSSLAGGLSNERVVASGTGITWDFSGASAAVANLDHLGIEDLTDPGADRGMFWDSSASATAWFTPSGGLAFEGANLTIADPDLAAIVSEASFALGDVLYHNGTTLARLPAGTSGQFLKTRGTFAAPTWESLPVGSGLGDMLSTNNLSELADAAEARINLGLVIGTNVQAYDADLTTWASLTPSANAQSLVTAADYAAMRALLDLEVGTDFYSIAATDGAIAAAVANYTLTTDLASTANAKGASLIGIEDAGGLITGATVEAALAENRAAIDAIEADYLQAADIATALFDADIGVTVQAYDAELAALAGLTSAADKVPYFTGAGTAAVTDFTSVARTLVNQTTQALMRTTGLGMSSNGSSLVAAADYAAMRALLDLEVGTDFLSPAAIAAAYQPLDADLNTWATLTPSANAQSLVTAANYAAMRTLLDLEVGTDFLSPAAIAAAYQPLDGELSAIAGLTSAADRLPYFTGSGTAALATFTTFARSILDDADEATFKATVNLEIGTDVQAYDADTLKADVADILAAGFAATPYNAGTKSSGTFTPDEANGNFQYATNGGAHTFAPPTNNGTMIVLYANDGSAGAITTSGFTQVTGDSLTTTSGHEFLFYVTKHNNGSAFSHLHVTALQ